MAVNNLISNGGFEMGTLQDWDATNVYVTASHSHAGRFSAVMPYGVTESILAQTVPMNGTNNVQLLVSLSKYGLMQSPRVTLRVSYLTDDNIEVGTGVQTEIVLGSLPNSLLNSWKEVYQITDTAPDAATQARVEIIKPAGRFYNSSVLVDDVALLDFELGPGEIPGPTGPTGPTGPV